MFYQSVDTQARAHTRHTQPHIETKRKWRKRKQLFYILKDSSPPLNDQFDMRHLKRKQKAIEKEEPFLYEGK